MVLSTRFYKRLILVVIALMIVVPTAASISLKVKNAALRRELAQAAEQAQAGRPGQALELTGAAIDYQTFHPELYSTAQVPQERRMTPGTVYLTFDCTPGENTWQILDTLDEYGVKATFFVTASADDEARSILKEIANRGHTVGLGSYSDSYQDIYQSVTDYLDDFQEIYDYVYTATGVEAQMFRFPGGSVNAYNSGIYRELIAEMLRRGFVFFDWNVGGEDASVTDPTPRHITQSVLTGMEHKDWAIVSLKDSFGKESVAKALPDIIEALQDGGYVLEPLAADVMPGVFSYKNAP